MKLLHTADWHLGQTLAGHERTHEHRLFLQWLLRTLQERQTDALLIAGDVFDQASPPAQAQALYYDFLAQARRALPKLAICIVAGNHDSPSRLQAPRELLAAFGMHVIGRHEMQADAAQAGPTPASCRCAALWRVALVCVAACVAVCCAAAPMRAATLAFLACRPAVRAAMALWRVALSKAMSAALAWPLPASRASATNCSPGSATPRPSSKTKAKPCASCKPPRLRPSLKKTRRKFNQRTRPKPPNKPRPPCKPPRPP